MGGGGGGWGWENVTLAWLASTEPRTMAISWIFLRKSHLCHHDFHQYCVLPSRQLFPYVIFNVVQIKLEQVIKFSIIEPWTKSNEFSKIDIKT